MFFDGIHGIDRRKMSMINLHISDSAPAHSDDLGDHQFKAISTVSVGLLDSNEAWATLFQEKRSDADVTIGSQSSILLLCLLPSLRLRTRPLTRFV
jgi:hypothetical protein